MRSRLTYFLTYVRLGPANIARVIGHRLGLKSGWHPVQRLRAAPAKPPFFRFNDGFVARSKPNVSWNDRIWWFGWLSAPLPGAPPDWFFNPFSSVAQSDATLDWWQIPDFGSGDIKGIWELSRMDWAVAWSTTSACGDSNALERLNYWLADWAKKNPPYKGPNWKCGQEASIRVLHLVTAAWVLDQDRSPERGLIDFLCTHLQRIALTMSYAIAQQNNHGTSEAAALFVGGTFLTGYDHRAKTWARTGRRWLENRARNLVESDGSFSQYSVTYHRMMLDTYSFAEAWRRRRALPAFSDQLLGRMSAATEFLWVMTDPVSGDAPNIGANDGAHLLQLSDTDYRDFRPSVQLAAALFLKKDALGEGSWTSCPQWLNVSSDNFGEPPDTSSFDDGGFQVLRKEKAMAVLRYPRFRFRPSQADALHVDLWFEGRNLLRDAGTFSYNSDDCEWFASSLAHNTVVFDNRDQMPRVSRFLFGDWLRAKDVQTARSDESSVCAAAGYTDRKGARHHRMVKLCARHMTCTDSLSGDFQQAELRWRLFPGPWVMDGDTLRGNGVSVKITVDGEPSAPILGSAPESRYYQNKVDVPLLSLIVDQRAQIVTEIHF